MKIRSAIVFPLVLLLLNVSSVFNVYAINKILPTSPGEADTSGPATGGSATSGSATGGSGSSGSTTCSVGATCNFYGGSATSGSAIGGPATGTGNTGGSPTNGQASGEPDSLGSTRGAFLDHVNQGRFSGPACKVYSLNDPTLPESHYIMYSGINNGHYITLNIPHRNGYSENDMTRLSEYCFELNVGVIVHVDNVKL